MISSSSIWAHFGLLIKCSKLSSGSDVRNNLKYGKIHYTIDTLTLKFHLVERFARKYLLLNSRETLAVYWGDMQNVVQEKRFFSSSHRQPKQNQNPKIQSKTHRNLRISTNSIHLWGTHRQLRIKYFSPFCCTNVFQNWNSSTRLVKSDLFFSSSASAATNIVFNVWAATNNDEVSSVRESTSNCIRIERNFTKTIVVHCTIRRDLIVGWSSCGVVATFGTFCFIYMDWTVWLWLLRLYLWRTVPFGDWWNVVCRCERVYDLPWFIIFFLYIYFVRCDETHASGQTLLIGRLLVRYAVVCGDVDRVIRYKRAHSFCSAHDKNEKRIRWIDKTRRTVYAKPNWKKRYFMCSLKRNKLSYWVQLRFIRQVCRWYRGLIWEEWIHIPHSKNDELDWPISCIISIFFSRCR